MTYQKTRYQENPEIHKKYQKRDTCNFLGKVKQGPIIFAQYVKLT